MPQRILFILVVLIFLFNGEVLGQEKNVEKIPVFVKKLQPNDGFVIPIRYKYPLKKPSPVITYSNQFPDVRRFIGSRLSPWGKLQWESPDMMTYYTRNLTFFCRIEHHFEKVTAVPLRFRLGSLAYTDYLEQKPNSSLR